MSRTVTDSDLRKKAPGLFVWKAPGLSAGSGVFISNPLLESHSKLLKDLDVCLIPCHLTLLLNPGCMVEPPGRL